MQNVSVIFPPSFLLLQQEGYLISSCLAAGLTQVRLANVHDKGAVYGALFNLSIGIERLLKAVVIIDHMLENGLAVPSRRQLKDYGHDIGELYDTCARIATRRGVPIPERTVLDSLDQELLSLLVDFAKTTRYHNLDALSSPQSGRDPLAHWGEILIRVLSQDVPEHQVRKIIGQRTALAKAVDDVMLTVAHGLDQRPLSTEEAFVLPGLHEKAAAHVTWRIVRILSPVRALVDNLSSQSYRLNVSVPPFPQMQEFLQWMFDDRASVLKKKKWP